MEQERFGQELLGAVGGLLPEGTWAEIQETERINGGVCRQVVIVEEGRMLSPCFRLDRIHGRSRQEGWDIQEAAEEVVSLYHRAVEGEYMGEVAGFRYRDPDTVREHMAFQLVNHGKNRKMLEHTAHVDLLDLALVYSVVVRQDESGDSLARMEKSWFGHFGWTEEEMYQKTMENTTRMFPVALESMMDVLRRAVGTGNTDRENTGCPEEMPAMLVATNPASLFLPGVLAGMAGERGKDLVLLPSSRHEMILLEAGGKKDLQEMADMVKTINRRHVAPEDVLSDHVYYYDREQDRVEMHGDGCHGNGKGETWDVQGHC